MTAYYNEIDPYAAEWLRNLINQGHISPGCVDERDIRSTTPDVPAAHIRCHFFAGIGGWDYALRLAGWPDDRPVWTGSCPCQPFSSAARGRQARRQDGERHLWPYWRRLISELSPSTVFGEQVAQAGDWFDEVCTDMEAMGYSIGAAILPACSIGADHARSRLFFVGHADGNSKPSSSINVEACRLQGNHSVGLRVVQKNGLPHRLARLRAFGNAIVPQVAAEFIRAVMETEI